MHRHAIDLFNHGYYWEAHEAWEALWVAVGRSGPVADLLKGLIKLAAAGVKLRAGNAAGVQRHAQRARQLFLNSADSCDNVSLQIGLSQNHLVQLAEQLTDRLSLPQTAMGRPVMNWNPPDATAQTNQAAE
ncbi:DUF309 domain-containing protein [bacterium]|nr:DUF309 domain-containing protein [bacterium]